MLQKTRYFLFLVTALVVIVVAFQNNHEVDIQVLFFSDRYPLTLLLLATIAISFLLGSFWMVWRSRRKRENRSGKRKNKTSSKTGTFSKKKSAPPQSADAVDELRR